MEELSHDMTLWYDSMCLMLKLRMKPAFVSAEPPPRPP